MMLRTGRHGARGVVRGGFDEQGDAVGRVAFVQHLLVVGSVATGSALDGGLDAVLRHVDRAGVLDEAPERRVRLGSGPPALTAIVMSLATRANCFAMRFQRANIVCLRTSNIRPMTCPE